MAISFRAVAGHSTNAETSAPHDIVINKPTGTVQNDVMLAFIQTQGNIGSFDSVPSGWTALAATGYRTPTTSNSGVFMGGWWKVAGASEATAYTWSMSGSGVFGAAIVAYSGCDSSAPIAVTGSTESDSLTDTTVQAPSVTSPVANGMLVTAHGANSQCTGCTVSFTPPTGMTERYDSNQTDDGTTLRAGLEIAELALSSTGATGTKDATVSNDGRNIGIAVVLAPGDQTISGAGAIATAEAFGTAIVVGPISSAGGIATAEAFGTPTVVAGQAISGAGDISSAETFSSDAIVNLHNTPTPQLLTDVGFPDNPRTSNASVTWSDIVSYVKMGSTNRGRSRESLLFEAGQLDLTLDNRDGRFEPETSGSPYFPYIQPNKRVRVRVAYNGTIYPVMNAYADSWDENFEKPGEAEVLLTGSDGFKVLGAAEIPAAWDQALAQLEDPYAWYRLDERSGTSAADAMGGTAGTYTGSPTLGATAAALGTQGTGVTFDNSGTKYMGVSPAPIPQSGSATTINFRSAQKAYNSSGVTQLSVSKPAGVIADDVLVACVTIRADSSISSVPSGWTLIRQDTTATTDNNGCRQAIYYKVAGSSEPSSYQWKTSASTDIAICIAAFSGVNTSTPIEVNDGTSSDDPNDTTCTAPSVTTTTATCMLVTFHGFNPATTTTATTSQTPPSGMTEAADTASVGPGGGDANRATCELNYLSLSSAGATGTKISSLDANDGRNVGQTIALKPSVTSGTPTPFTVAFWFEQSAHSSSNVYAKMTGTTFFDVVQVATTNKLRFRISDGTIRGNYEADVAPSLNTETLVVVRYDGATTMKIATSGGTAQTTITALASAYSMSSGDLRVGLTSSTMDEVVVWQRYLSDTEVAVLLAVAGGTQTTNAAITAALDYMAWPSDLRDLESGGQTVSKLVSVAAVGDKVLDYMQDVITTERGGLYMDRAGNVRFETYTFVTTDASRTTAGVTFGSSTGEVPYHSVKMDFSEQPVINEVRVSNETTENGTVGSYTENYAVEDTTSVEENGRRTLSLQTNYDASNATRPGIIQTRMDYELSRRKDAHRRITEISVGPFEDLTHWPTVLGIELLDRVHVNHTTPRGTVISKDLTVEGISHSWQPGSWVITFQLADGV